MLRFPGVPALSVVIYVVKNASRPKPVTFSPVQDGKRFAFQVGWIVTLTKGLFKCFLPKAQLKVCGAIDKEIGKFKHQVYFGLISTIAESAPNSSESSSTDIPLICPSLV